MRIIPEHTRKLLTDKKEQTERDWGASLQVYQYREFYFSFQKKEFSKGNRRVELNQAEQRLLRFLIGNRGRILVRRDLLRHIWAESAVLADESALSAAVKHLRDKLEDNPGSPRYIKTVYGVGYTWADGRNGAEE